MANKILNMIFKADTSQAKKALSDLAGEEGKPGGVMGITGALAGLSTLVQAGVISGIALTMKKAFGDYSDYITEVDNLRYSLSLTVEEASFLVAAMGRYEISNDTMVAVFRKLSTEGVDPTVENLGKLLAQWEAMPAGSEKGQFAMQMFGEQGIKQLLPWWEKLTAAEKEHFGLQEDGVLVTDDMIEKNQEYKESVADLTDQWDIMKMELLGGVIPALTATMDYITNAVKIAKGLAEQWAIISGHMSSFGGAGAGGMPSYAANASRPYNTKGATTGGVSQITLDYMKEHGYGGFATGGSFTVGGRGGIDSTPVSFMATPGETVTVGGGTNDNQEILAEIRRLVRSLPVAIRDGMERI